MTTLLEKLQSATEGSRELSDACLLAWGFEESTYIGLGDPTRDLQDAVAAVPEGWVWSVSTDYELPGIARLHCTFPYADAPPMTIKARAATPALALCIAIEKARNA